MPTPIRLSPSGPIIGNAGAGFTLRMNEAVGEPENTIQVGLALAAVPLVATLAAPDRTKAYRATMYLDVRNTTTNQPVDVTMRLTASYDGGATFPTVLGTVTHHLGAGPSDGSARQMRIDVPLSLGSGAPWNMADPEPVSVQVRGEIQASLADTALVSANDTNAVYVSLSELLPS